MTRDEIKEEILTINSNNILLEMGTGIGKSRYALELIKKHNPKTILITIPKLVLIQNWKDEFIKWKCGKYISRVTFTTYVSIPKQNTQWDMVIFDECHHLSERCRDTVKYWDVKYNILLSATVGRKIKEVLYHFFDPLYIYKVSARKAIEDNILPNPKVYLVEMSLNTNPADKIYHWRKRKNGKKIVIPYTKKWQYLNNKTDNIYLQCTEMQYYQEITSSINYFKQKQAIPACKNKFLKLSLERLKTLADWKLDNVIWLLHSAFKNNRTITFCKDIEQTSEVGTYCINSKNKQSQKNLDDFNNHKINHISACSMLNEGINLADCQIGIFVMLNSSERIIVQKLGRILRHPNPKIVILYFKNTREEEIVKMMCENCDENNITVIKNYEDLIKI